MPREVTISSSASSASSGSRDSLYSPQDWRHGQDLPSLQDLSRKFADARSKLRQYDCSKADERLKEWEKERQELNQKHRLRKTLARQSRSVLVASCAVAEQCLSPPHIRGSLVMFD
jgi:hypothetical protein